MNSQLDFDLAAARRARDEAIDHVVDPPFAYFARAALKAVMAERDTFTADHVWAELDRMGIPRPIEPRALGPIMLAAIKARSIRNVGTTPCRRRSRHAAPIAMYEVVTR